MAFHMQSVFGAVLCAMVLIIYLSIGASHTGRRSSFIAEYLEETQVSTSVNADQNGKLHAHIPADLEIKKLVQGILPGQSNHSDRNGSPPRFHQQGVKGEVHLSQSCRTIIVDLWRNWTDYVAAGKTVLVENERICSEMHLISCKKFAGT